METERTFNIHKTRGKRPERRMNVLHTINLRSMSRDFLSLFKFMGWITHHSAFFTRIRVN